MQVEVNVLNKNFTADVTEWHDGPGNRGASVEWIMGFPIKNIYSYSTNEIFNFADEAGEYDGVPICFVTSMSR